MRQLRFSRLFQPGSGATRGVNTSIRPASLPGQPKFVTLRDIDGGDRRVHIIDMPGTGGDKANKSKVPMILLGGAAQTIYSWMPHYRGILKGRRLIIPEMRCQGKTELLSEHMRMDVLVSDFANLMKELDLEKCDLVGFSYGGRVALAVAAHRPELVRRLSITGVSPDRGGLGKCILESWKRAFENGNLEEASWSFVLNGYSNSFIEQNMEKIETHVDMVIKSNDVNKLKHLYSNATAETDPYSVQSCVHKLKHKGLVKDIQIMAGVEDRITSIDGTRQLNKYMCENTLGLWIKYEELLAGHLLPFEQPLQWRTMLLNFLDHEHDRDECNDGGRAETLRNQSNDDVI